MDRRGPAVAEAVGVAHAGPLGPAVVHEVDEAVGTELPVVITANQEEIGVVTKPRLLRGIQGGKE